MARWVMKLEIEGNLGVESGLPSLVFKHPSGRYEVHLENKDMAPGAELPLLNAHLLFDEANLDAAQATGNDLIRQFLDFLAFASGARFRVRRPLCLLDWSGGIAAREGYVFRSFADPDWPQLVLNDSLSPALELLARADADRELMSAVRWFAFGAAARFPDQQFQMFWFAIETLAQRTRSREKVADRCATCRDELYCRTCERVSEHRPYPSQAIEQLFHRYISDEPARAYEIASSTRHALLHADDLAAVEKRNGMSLGEAVDLAGRLAWTALLDVISKSQPEGGTVSVNFIRPESFLHRRASLKLQVGLPWQQDRAPTFADLLSFEEPTLKVNLIVTEQAGKKSEGDDENGPPRG